jgi:hypothetical protein
MAGIVEWCTWPPGHAYRTSKVHVTVVTHPIEVLLLEIDDVSPHITEILNQLLRNRSPLIVLLLVKKNNAMCFDDLSPKLDPRVLEAVIERRHLHGLKTHIHSEVFVKLGELSDPLG